MAQRGLLAVILVGLLAIAASMTAFTVGEQELAIKFKLGRIVRTGYEPGLHFLVPLVNNVRKFDKRIHDLWANNLQKEFLPNEDQKAKNGASETESSHG
jgi:membrane protease subunit HflC